MTNASDVKPVLFVVSSNTVKGATGIPTGYNLAEVTHPLEKLQEAGIRVEFASPKGGDAPLDGLEDMNDPVIARYWADLSTAETKPATGRRKTRPVAGIERHGARARQIAGAGHGALARRAKSRLLDQVLGGVFRARLWPSR